MLCIGDFHLKDLKHKNKSFDSWQMNMFRASFQTIYKLIEQHKPTTLVLMGDVFDKVPTGESLVLFNEFMEGLPEYIEGIIAFDGNHELITGVSQKLYYWNVTKDFFFNNYGIAVLDYEEINGIQYCSHQHIHKLERLNKNVDIVFSHFRSGITNLVSDEIDVTALNHRAKLVVLGDIHTRLNYDNIVYTGSPIDTEFSLKNDEENHQPSVLLLEAESRAWQWLDTLTTKYRKKKRVFSSVKKFLEEADRLKEDFEINKNFYKVVIQDKKINLKRLDQAQYKDFIIFDLVRVDLEVEKENKEVLSKITESLAKNNVSDNLLEFILKNNEHTEWVDSIRSVFANYEKAVK